MILLFWNVPGFDCAVCIKKLREEVQIILWKPREIYIAFIDMNVDIIPWKLRQNRGEGVSGVVEKKVFQFRRISL